MCCQAKRDRLIETHYCLLPQAKSGELGATQFYLRPQVAGYLVQILNLLGCQATVRTRRRHGRKQRSEAVQTACPQRRCADPDAVRRETADFANIDVRVRLQRACPTSAPVKDRQRLCLHKVLFLALDLGAVMMRSMGRGGGEWERPRLSRFSFSRAEGMYALASGNHDAADDIPRHNSTHHPTRVILSILKDWAQMHRIGTAQVQNYSTPS